MWTNTCCSHQLHGQDPPEVDDAALAAATGEAPGAAAAAVRKLWHELGVEPGAVPASAFKLVARLHYCARDEGNPEPWGEHELDYVLLARVPTAAQAQQGSSSSSAAPSPSSPAFALRPNPEEVGEARWVTRGELGAMLRDPALRWSPWFRIIADKWLLPEWWSSSSSDGGDGGDGGWRGAAGRAARELGRGEGGRGEGGAPGGRVKMTFFFFSLSSFFLFLLFLLLSLLLFFPTFDAAASRRASPTPAEEERRRKGAQEAGLPLCFVVALRLKKTERKKFLSN